MASRMGKKIKIFHGEKQCFSGKHCFTEKPCFYLKRTGVLMLKNCAFHLFYQFGLTYPPVVDQELYGASWALFWSSLGGILYHISPL